MILKSYAGEHKTEYMKYIEGICEGKKVRWKNSFYIDPDSMYSGEFYSNLTDFLNTMENKKNKGSWSFKLASAKKSNDEKKGWDIPPSIEVLEEGKPVLYLRSDQFGCSVPHMDRAWGDKYPYARFLKSSNRKNKFEIVTDAIWMSRTIGGSFLWPIVRYTGQQKHIWMNTYNTQRGAKSYIQDRVDLTLLEIKSVLDSSECGDTNILLSHYKDSAEMKKWLKHFGPFEKYIDMFCFGEEFIDPDSKMPLDLLTDEPIKDISKVKRIEDMNSRELCKMICHIKSRIEARSKRIIEILNNSN